MRGRRSFGIGASVASVHLGWLRSHLHDGAYSASMITMPAVRSSTVCEMIAHAEAYDEKGLGCDVSGETSMLEADFTPGTARHTQS